MGAINMLYSKFSDLEFDENQWVVSLINTKTGFSSIWSGHAKIVVEGIKKKTDNNTNLFATELFIAEYHIMEAERMPEYTWLPQVCRNTKCKFMVLCKEENHYNDRQEQQYHEVQSRSVGALDPAKVMKMIAAIKKEKNEIDTGQIVSNFQYAGKWCFYGEENAHNCTTWAEEKLDIIGIGKYLITDNSKAAPYLHTSSSWKCDVM